MRTVRIERIRHTLPHTRDPKALPGRESGRSTAAVLRVLPSKSKEANTKLHVERIQWRMQRPTNQRPTTCHDTKAVRVESTQSRLFVGICTPHPRIGGAPDVNSVLVQCIECPFCCALCSVLLLHQHQSTPNHVRYFEVLRCEAKRHARILDGGEEPFGEGGVLT